MLFLQEWRTCVQVALETDKITQAAFEDCEWLIVATEVRGRPNYLRCHGVIQKDIHVSFMDLVHDFLPHCDISEMLIEKSEIKRLDGAVSARYQGMKACD